MPHVDYVPAAGLEHKIRPPVEHRFCAGGHVAIKGQGLPSRGGRDRGAVAHTAQEPLLLEEPRKGGRRIAGRHPCQHPVAAGRHIPARLDDDQMPRIPGAGWSGRQVARPDMVDHSNWILLLAAAAAAPRLCILCHAAKSRRGAYKSTPDPAFGLRGAAARRGFACPRPRPLRTGGAAEVARRAAWQAGGRLGGDHGLWADHGPHAPHDAKSGGGAVVRGGACKSCMQSSA